MTFLPLRKGPSLSRARLQTLPFFCLSVSGRKLAPSAPSLRRVSRTESGQLASGWHHSSPFPEDQPDFDENAPHHAARGPFCRRLTLMSVACPSRKTTLVKRRCARPRSRASRPTSRLTRHALDQLLDARSRILALEWRSRQQASFIASLTRWLARLFVHGADHREHARDWRCRHDSRPGQGDGDDRRQVARTSPSATATSGCGRTAAGR